jgi:hypothetical protein
VQDGLLESFGLFHRAHLNPKYSSPSDLSSILLPLQVFILKDLFAPKQCKIQGRSELRILKDLADKARDCGGNESSSR